MGCCRHKDQPFARKCEVTLKGDAALMLQIFSFDQFDDVTDPIERQ